MDPQATEIQDEGCYVGLTHDHLNAQDIMNRVRSPQAGAIVLFAGWSTRIPDGVGCNTIY